jgi:protein-S-isoprenylcysteine O-methyltransferase Ste14
VILGFFAVALVVAVVHVRALASASSERFVPSSSMFVVTGALCLLAFLLRTTGEARVGSAVYGQGAAGHVVTSGPFRLLRHPLYAGTWLFFVASTTPYLPAVVAAVLALAFALALRAIAVHEEAHLHDRHGDAWRRYAAAVPRFLGVPRAVDDDGISVTAAALAAAALSNLGMLSLGVYRVVTGLGLHLRGLGLVNVLAIGLWVLIVVVRRFGARDPEAR